MKNFKLAISVAAALFIGFINQSHAQTVNLSQLDISKVAIAKNTGTSSSGRFYLNETPSNLVTQLGTALSVTTEYSEMDETNQTVYKYNGARFSFEGNKLVDFHISNSNFYVITNETFDTTNPYKYHYKVGDAISRVGDQNYGSYSAREKNRLFFQIYRTQTTYTEIAGKPRPVTEKILLDNTLLFEYSNGIITSFYF
jgi:hypothetical protein